MTGSSMPDAPLQSTDQPVSGGMSDRRIWGLSLAGAITMFVVQPPADLWMLAWLAPLPWLWLVQGPGITARHLCRAVWTAGFFHWLLAIHWLRLPHPATSIGWVALAAYLALYLPHCVWGARRMVHTWGWPLGIAAPIAWMGCEQARGWVLGGFTFGALGHTQWRWTTLVQCADICGAVGVSGVVMAVAAGLLPVVSWTLRGGWMLASRRTRAVPMGLATATVAMAGTLAYGTWRIAGEPQPQPERRPLDVLLVQGSIDTELKHDPAAAEQVARHYDGLTVRALAQEPGQARPDLVVWPETMWRFGLLEIDPAEILPRDVVEQTLGPEAESTGTTPEEQRTAARQARCREALERERLDALGAFARRYRTNWLVGLDRQVVGPHLSAGVQNFNCALFLDPEGQPLGRYDKMYPVLFGEYIPLADRFPWLYRLTPLPAGLTAGTHGVAVTIAGYRVAATICYETALPEAVRSLMLALEQQNNRPDVIVNLTNDGWFWGSSELDMHLTAAIFRAIEVRTPVVIAANTGFSAWIDSSGRLLARGPRRNTATLRAKVVPDGRQSPWLAWGALPMGVCMAVLAAAVLETILRGSRGCGALGDGSKNVLEMR